MRWWWIGAGFHSGGWEEWWDCGYILKVEVADFNHGWMQGMEERS